jgi:hypothetical protein
MLVMIRRVHLNLEASNVGARCIALHNIMHTYIHAAVELFEEVLQYGSTVYEIKHKKRDVDYDRHTFYISYGFCIIAGRL